MMTQETSGDQLLDKDMKRVSQQCRHLGPHADALNPVTQPEIAAAGRKYLEEHVGRSFQTRGGQIDNLLLDMLEAVLKDKPADIVQYTADLLQFGRQAAQQDTELGLPLRRIEQLTKAFNFIDKGASGSISFRAISDYTGNLSSKELEVMLKGEGNIHGRVLKLEDFLQFFSKLCFKMNNNQFEDLMQEMMA